MPDTLLVLNAGSSSLKFSAFLDQDPPGLLLRGQIEALSSHPKFSARQGEALIAEKEWPAGTSLGHHGSIEFLLDWCRSGVLGPHQLAAVGHRVVHGGTRLAQPRRIDEPTLSEIEALVPLAPLHQPTSVAVIKTVARMAPALPQVACFDTAFHRTQPRVAQALALPRRFAEEGVRGYGFHGLSYEHIASRLPAVDRRAAEGRTVVAHLGNGASLCALAGGKSIATTMSFSALDGLVMGSRCGALDPGVLLYLMNRHGMAASDLERLLYEESGLLGVSGISSDMRELLESADPRAAEAVDLFVYRIGRELGSLAAALGGLDGLVFTGGIGENAASIRGRVCESARWLGVALDEEANAAGGPCLTRSDSRAAAWVIPANEELMIALHTQSVLGP